MILALFVPLVLLAAGTLGYRWIEGWSLFDALYMTVTTVATVGFREVHPLSPAGQVFTMVLILGGVYTLFYAASELIGAVVRGEVRRSLGRQRMERSLAEMQQHVIVCGYGRMGRLVCQEFSALGTPLVVVERNPDPMVQFDLPHGVALHGDATSDEVLRRAGAERARALVTVVASDADNLYITMSARLLNAKLFIVAAPRTKAPKPSSCGRERAGWFHPTSPAAIGSLSRCSSPRCWTSSSWPPAAVISTSRSKRWRYVPAALWSAHRWSTAGCDKSSASSSSRFGDPAG
jgi:voltage-gated potassium channel